MGEVDGMELIYSLVGFPDETEWIEFKEGNRDPIRTGRDISALANAAAYCGRACAYEIWGVTDRAHELVGTRFNPYHAKGKGNQELLMWLKLALSNNANYEFSVVDHEMKRFVVLKVRAASAQPVYFDKTAYIREGSSTAELVPGSEREAELWRRLQAGNAELAVVEGDLTPQEVADLLDIDAYFELCGMRRPIDLEGAVLALCEQELILHQDNGRYSMTRLGMLLVGKQLSRYPELKKRMIRIVRYAGKGNFGIIGDTEIDCGYALALPRAEQLIMSMVPAAEAVDGAFRRIQTAYPQRAIRELLSNIVIHQDIADNTAGPLVAIYDDRIEFSNPGTTVIPAERVLNAQPKTRNSMMAALMRQMDLCEEGGTGWDLIVDSLEKAGMPSPTIKSAGGLGTLVTLFGDRPYARMKKSERKNAVYWHACLLYAQGESMSNQSLRQRFGLSSESKNVVAISRLIKECADEGFIKEEDEDAGNKYRRYIPFWA